MVTGLQPLAGNADAAKLSKEEILRYSRHLIMPEVGMEGQLKLKRAKGRVKTAPTGGPCVVHITKNGASIFAADANAINIAVSTLEDTSDTVDVAFAIGDYLSVKVTTVNAAADLTVSLDAFIEAITAA